MSSTESGLVPSSFTSEAVMSFSRRPAAFYRLVDVIVLLLKPSRHFPSQTVPWVLSMPFQGQC
jgi:hypothetical protein